MGRGKEGYYFQLINVHTEVLKTGAKGTSGILKWAWDNRPWPGAFSLLGAGRRVLRASSQAVSKS